MLTVKLPHHQYDIIIKRGALKEVGTWVQNLWQSQKIAVVSDSNVFPIYGKEVEEQLRASGFDAYTYVVPAGEQSKSLVETSRIYDFLAEHDFTRSDGVIALGGGVIGDLAGFVASTYMRGLHFLQIPTSLLAQVDSSIGGKTGVNTEKAKNLVGTFSQPDGVLIDPDTLDTLPMRRIREGIAEIIKSAAIADLDLWELLGKIPDEKALVESAEAVISGALKVKRKVVEEDEFDNGVRLTLNFGHTIGHAIENTAGYGVISHGEAVAIGMVKISQAAEDKHLTPAGTTIELIEMIEKYHLPTTYEIGSDDALFQAVMHDKKTRGKQIKIVLLDELGSAKVMTIPTEEFKTYLN